MAMQRMEWFMGSFCPAGSIRWGVKEAFWKLCSAAAFGVPQIRAMIAFEAKWHGKPVGLLQSLVQFLPHACDSLGVFRDPYQVLSFAGVLLNIIKFVGVPKSMVLDQFVLLFALRECRWRLWETGFPIVFIDQCLTP